MEHSVKLFEHAYELFNLIGHAVIMNGNRTMTGCLQTFGGHCLVTFSDKHLLLLHRTFNLILLFPCLFVTFSEVMWLVYEVPAILMPLSASASQPWSTM